MFQWCLATYRQHSKIVNKLKNKSDEQKYLPIYRPSKSDMYVVLANMHEYLCSWTFKFLEVVRRQISGEVVAVIPSFSAVHPWI